MKIVEQIKWRKLIIEVWDEEFKQTCGKVEFNYPKNDYIFTPDNISFDSKQLMKISKLIKKFNDVKGGKGE